jgi:hypothetical protein
LQTLAIIGVSGSRDVSGLSCDFGCHMPPDVSTLSFKLKAETWISLAASKLHVRWVPRICTEIQDFNPLISETLNLYSGVYI